MGHLIKQKESEIQTAICDWLQMRGYFFWRNNTIPVYDSVKKRYRRMNRHALAGVPDIILIDKGIFVGLEVKTATGKQSAAQKSFDKRCEEAGGNYFIVRSIKDCEEIGL